MNKVIICLIVMLCTGCAKKQCYNCYVTNGYTQETHQIADYCGKDVKDYMNEHTRTYNGFGGTVYRDACYCSHK